VLAAASTSAQISLARVVIAAMLTGRQRWLKMPRPDAY
jgi:hypothetical protein